jgi:Synergist-CTERM protein sorting domain-containing protein
VDHRGIAHAAEAWTNRKTGTSVSYTSRGRNDENVQVVEASISFSFSPTITPDDSIYFNARPHGALVSPAVRARLTELGLTGTVANSGNVTGTLYVRDDHDAMHKTLKAYNNYYRKFGVPDHGYTGEIKEDRPDFIAGGTYSNSFRYTGLLQEGRMIAIGGWGGRGTLHGWNERIEVDGMVDFAKRGARTYAELAAGVPHTWTVTGSAYTPLNRRAYQGFPEKAKLKYALSNDVISDIYLQEEIAVKPIVAKLYAEGKIPRGERTEILFARKFWKDDAFTLTVDLTNANGVATGSGKVYLFLRDMRVNPNSNDIDGTWNLGDGTYAGIGTAGRVAHTFHNAVPGHWYNQRSGDAQVEASVIALVVTNGASVPLNSEDEEDFDTDGTIREHVKDEIKSNSGCNAGFAFFALALLPFITRRRN